MIARLTALVQLLDASFDLELHSEIDQAYYMQKLEELKLLKAQLEEADEKLRGVQHRVHTHYTGIYKAWRADVRKIQRFTE